MSSTAILALGSNLGDSQSIVAGAVRELRDHPQIRLLRMSPVAVTAPVGGPEGQGDYLNQVLEVETKLGPFALLELAHRVEQKAHRERDLRWGPRTLDVDLIVYGSLEMEDPLLTLPHPRAAERAFVLEPWARMDPEATLGGVSVALLARRAPDAGGILGWVSSLEQDEQERNQADE